MIFDKEKHEYRDGEIVVRSVTQILSDAGIINSRWFTADAMERGTAVHELCQRYASGERVDKIGRPLTSLEYVNALARWFCERRVYAIATEQMIDAMIDGRRYAGTFDLLANIDGKRVLVDYKTGAGMKWHPAQIAAYALAVNPDRCIMLHLKADGTYREKVVQGGDLVSGLSQFRDAILFGL